MIGFLLALLRGVRSGFLIREGADAMLMVDLRETRAVERGRHEEHRASPMTAHPRGTIPGKQAVTRRSDSERPLSLSEVRRIGRPALFLDWGETLLFREGALFDLEGALDERALADPPKVLPIQIMETAVGIEYGWRHLAGCDCPSCEHDRVA